MRKQPMKTKYREWSLVPRRITTERWDSSDSQWLLYRSRWEAATQGQRMVQSLYAQIGVLNLQLLITANAIGERAISAWLTFHIPRGGWFLINRYRSGLSKLRSTSQPMFLEKGLEAIPSPNGNSIVVRKKRRWWSYLTQG